MVDETGLADVTAINGDHVDCDEIDEGISGFPSFEVRPSGLEPCGICGRTFLPESLARHAPICQRNAQKGDRKQFDMTKQRLSELEISQINVDSASQSKRGKENTPVTANHQDKPNWKIQHDELHENIRNAREITKAVKEGKPVPPPTKPAGPRPGYMQCEYCERHFSKTAAERHIEFCKEQKNRLIQPQVDNNALTRLIARTKYKAPKLKPPGTPARVPSFSGGLKPPTATPGILANQQQCQSAGSSPVTIRKTREDKDSSVRRRHHTLSPMAASRRSELTPRYFDDDSDDDELTSDKSWRGGRGADKSRHTDSGSGSRLKKASSDKGLDDAEPSERTKGGGGESEAVGGVVNGRPNRMSYPAGAVKGPLRKKRSSSRLTASSTRGSTVKPPRDVSPAGSASSANSATGGCGLKNNQPAKPAPIQPPADSDIPGTSGPESPPIINRSQSFPDKQLLRRYHPSLQQPPGGAPDSAASGSESASATAGERRSWSANNALPPLARGSAGGNGSPRPQLRPLLSVKPPSETTNGIAPGRAGTKSPSSIGNTNSVRRSRIAKQTKETRFAQRSGGDIDSRMTASVPPGADLDFSGSADVGSNIIPVNASMTASAYFPQREGQLKLPPLPPSSSDGDLGYLSNNSDGGVGNSHGQGIVCSGVSGEAILAKFCHSCGTRFPISWARFCCMCGEKRLWMNPADKLPPI